MGKGSLFDPKMVVSSQSVGDCSCDLLLDVVDDLSIVHLVVEARPHAFHSGADALALRGAAKHQGHSPQGLFDKLGLGGGGNVFPREVRIVREAPWVAVLDTYIIHLKGHHLGLKIDLGFVHSNTARNLSSETR